MASQEFIPCGGSLREPCEAERLRMRPISLLSWLLPSLLLAAVTLAEEPTPSSEPEEWDDPTCDLEKSGPGLEPQRLIQEFLKRDGDGQFVRGGKWFQKAITCPGHLGGPDYFTAIRSYKI